jgi:hypothetical protein
MRRKNRMDPRFLRPGFGFALAHAIEEAGEFIAAAGKTGRWGRDSYNPDLPPEQRETNEEWVKREMRDLRHALDRLEVELNR